MAYVNATKITHESQNLWYIYFDNLNEIDNYFYHLQHSGWIAVIINNGEKAIGTVVTTEMANNFQIKYDGNKI